MKNIAVILAGGIGARVGGGVPKQLLPLEDGRSVLEHAIDAFEHAALIDGILIVMHPSYMAEADVLRLRNPWQKVLSVVPGGRERWESSVHAIEWLMMNHVALSIEPDAINVLLHDAARPFVSETIIANVCAALAQHEAVTVAVPATDTMYEIHDGMLVRIPNRSTMMRAQTPQAFRLNLIDEAYRLALADPALQATDDCGIVHRYLPSAPVFIVEGEEANRKITFREDIGSKG